MQQRRIGAMDVSAIGLGAMPLSLKNRPTEKDAIQVIHQALELGVTFIDTADVYCMDHRDIGHNERLIAKALKEKVIHQYILVATKGSLERPDGAWTCNGRPEHLQAACEASIRALGVERIALYQIHAPDEEVPWADTVGAVARLREQGKVEMVGLSNVTVDQIEEAREIVPVVSVQNRCNVMDRSAWEEGVIRYCEVEGLAFLPYCPVGGGGPERESIRTNRLLNSIGSRHQASPFEVALAWLLQKSPVMVPIPGASRPSSIQSSVRATSLVLSASEIQQIDRDLK